MVNETPKLDIQNLGVSYADKVALRDISLSIEQNEIFGIIGPANAGKTSFLKAINRKSPVLTSSRD